MAIPLWALFSAIITLVSTIAALWLALNRSQEARVSYATAQRAEDIETATKTANVIAAQAEQTRLVAAELAASRALLASLERTLAILVGRPGFSQT